MLKKLQEKSEIAVLYAGGRQQKISNLHSFNRWFKECFEIDMISHITPILISKEPVPTGIAHLLKVARRIAIEWKRYHGFVVIVAPGALAFASNFLRLLFGALGKPIIFVSAGSQHKMTTPEATPDHKYTDLDLRANIANAVSVAGSNIAGVLAIVNSEIMPPKYIYRAGKQKEQIIKNKKPAKPQDDKEFGRIDFGIQIKSIATKRSAILPKLDLSKFHHTHLHEINGKFLSGKITFPKKTTMLLLRSQQPFSLSVLDQIPKNIPTLLISNKVGHIYHRGKLKLLPRFESEIVAAVFVWFIGGGVAGKDLFEQFISVFKKARRKV
ncbi:MAG: hypothetical protein A2233_04465 [Candidatus Kerfeldbacteria bacterium RIFOXYA2_FULL_38_24]|uniref:L-asparaginase N-terminal domain-containing protein n=1 Tax=Candidatus Kerfeldbacteria bacterium RIFOXYB2_FULL_38_14 TaxID=1798547 RepID=A0A1G2BB48_9BACT|nr:MAG: hypothetical protein A2233_04465 [Candidatus Kerfeldbacteria bacterium RIFOXYA2_FULL_38_24]OGY86352.1 MAG: hypothetical protein A2319_03065 [Candidatus Kerfeldbacteria bacterium RIFOXYB2_FULL_38_14]OGY89851.1 MAG: hypothetical protein A2458_04985 [Candidatus Kerfeldbacteria bacterium RIFOXYC2_FULL_38_9]